MSILIPDRDLDETLFAIASTREPPSTKTNIAREILQRVTADFDPANPDRWKLPAQRPKAKRATPVTAND